MSDYTDAMDAYVSAIRGKTTHEIEELRLAPPANTVYGVVNSMGHYITWDPDQKKAYIKRKENMAMNNDIWAKETEELDRIIEKERYRHYRSRFLDNYLPTKIIFSGPATICFFSDGSKEVVKRSECDDVDDREKAVLYCVMKHHMRRFAQDRNYNHFRKELYKKIDEANDNNLKGKTEDNDANND